VTDVIQQFNLTIPAGNGSQALYYVDCHLGWADVTQIILSFPPGCSSLVGARIEFAVNPVYPIGAASFFTLDDYVLTIPVTGQGNSGQWRISGYNTDIYQHTVTGYFFYNYVSLSQQQQSSALISL
jgi:hypothetical protein